MAISKVERLVNLVIALLSTRGFITAEKIRSSVAGYSDSPSDRGVLADVRARQERAA